jgi:hypothetical protein
MLPNYLFTSHLLFLPSNAFWPRDHSRSVISKVILGGKDMTGMAYPEGFR